MPSFRNHRVALRMMLSALGVTRRQWRSGRRSTKYMTTTSTSSLENRPPSDCRASMHSDDISLSAACSAGVGTPDGILSAGGPGASGGSWALLGQLAEVW